MSVESDSNKSSHEAVQGETLILNNQEVTEITQPAAVDTEKQLEHPEDGSSKTAVHAELQVSSDVREEQPIDVEAAEAVAASEEKQQADIPKTAVELEGEEEEEEEVDNGVGGTEDSPASSSSSSSSPSSSDTSGDDDQVGREEEQEEKLTNDIESEVKQLPAEPDNVDKALLEKQFKVIKEACILQNPSFRNASEQEQISALIAILNSDPQTAMPHATALATSTITAASESKGKNVRFPRPNMSQPMSAEEKERYSEYLNGETKITEIQSFPPKSRLFIGNLPLKNVTKEDLFRIFSPYGHIFQINIKNAFGFIQYDNQRSVLDAIEFESEEMNFGKKLILEVSSSNARPQFDHGDHGSNTSSTYVTSSKRNYDNEENDDEDMYSDNHYKKSKKRTPQCLIYVKKAADRTYAYSVFTNLSKKTGLETDMVILKPRMELRKLVNEAAYDGVWGVVLVNKNKNIDVQTFYLGPSGETKSDEYVAVSIDEAISIFNNIKSTKIGPPARSPVMNSQPYGMQPHNVMPQQPYGYMPPQQQYPGNMPMMPQQQMYGNMPPTQNYGMPPPPPPQQGHGYQGYPQHPQMMPQQGGLDQNQLLAALQNLPPNVVLNLLQLAQQPNQQQQQQALGVIQQIQAGIPLQQQQQQQLQQQSHLQQTPPQQSQQSQQPQQPPQPPQQQSPYGNYMPPQNQQDNRSSQDNGNSQQHTQTQAQAQAQNNNNVQSLLDSLAKLQK